ncbi:hypothetical protein GLOTRDRAFT_52392 [Gloeophyllum trabeum ATCC 11539]|uniref:CSC1/OSCA1-like 7TM region domain-containing protein n=1 Tax=Gloeophyllum trabeum (strain ATCC 11539 / FP-39264 / Madison 617) TaxID=670483 RepID=S7QKM5_GLOTA|nr:uncharacterized protein GLOTRDRAFT_52392 [Gloeophyllum trabeum ATCC 11539]EPQ60336.1 hypothetical protein GLOTRDRAFT_52392 [Gloeophyllum trabeum ATCC 11539]
MTTSFTTSTPVTTIADPSTTFTSFSSYVASTTIFDPAVSQTPVVAAQAQPVCIGDGLDALSAGLIETIVIPSAIGLLLWLLFAIIRPRFREIYGLREWFPPPDLRPKPLGDKLWTFLFPPVPLVPAVPKDVSDTGRSPVKDAELFPSDEQLSQRTLWMAFLVVLGWSVVGLAGALPLYLVSTSCMANSAPHATYIGVYSVLQDLSLLRLLQYYDSQGSSIRTIPTFVKRAPDGSNQLTNARIRIIILTVLLIVLAVIPGVWKILKEFNRIVAYRERWLKVRCGGMDLAWLSARRAPGFRGWGERRLKEFIVKSGLSSSLETENTGNRRRVRNASEQPLTPVEEESLEVDIQGLFSIGDTRNLAMLIEERDEILENLEIAETKYISSFRLSTPDPSIADLEPTKEEGPHDGKKPYISRPLPLGAGARRNSRRNRARNPAYGSSSLTPTSYVAPSQYYKLGNLRGVNSDHASDASQVYPSLSDSINQRVVGSRFQEISNRNSGLYGTLPLGSHVKLKSGELRRVDTTTSEQTIPDPSRYGPNYGADAENTTASHYRGGGTEVTEELGGIDEGDEWVDVMHEPPQTFERQDYFGGYAPLSRRPPRSMQTPPVERRETFPLRARSQVGTVDQPPPHLRLQSGGPFVRPLSGLDHESLGAIYADISRWRTQLKAVNQEIAEAQRDGYNDIAEGARIKGWLLVGRGLRFIPGAKIIEGRAKEDIRWDELQHEMSHEGKVFAWIVLAVTSIILAAALTAVAGLALGSAPDFAHYFPFLAPLAGRNDWTAGLALCLAPAVAGSLFICMALTVTVYVAQATGAVSISGLEMITFKTCFYVLTAVGAIWLITIGAVLFAMRAWSMDTERTRSVADGSIYMSFLALMFILNVAIISPALLLLQPGRLLRIPASEKHAVTPRQRFRAVYPSTYNASFATGCCIIGLIFASTFSLIFPLIGPAVVILIFLTLIAHRYLVGYVYGRTRSQTGGLLQLWLLKRFGTLVAFQPFLMGLIFLTRRLWPEAGVLLGAAMVVVMIVEGYATWKTRQPGVSSLSNVTRNSLDTFGRMAQSRRLELEEESLSLVSSSNRNTRMRGSFASVLEMMSMTLAVAPALTRQKGPVPLPTETIDDLTATERAARTHPDAPPHLPPLSFADHAQEMSGVLYAPELLAPEPIIWLPNDSSGIGRSEARDLDKYHHLKVTLDVTAQEDVLAPHRLSASR